jgi:uncharacterized protein YjdB
MLTIPPFRPLEMFLYVSVVITPCLLNACGGNGSSPTVPSSIVLSPSNGRVVITQTRQFTAIAIFTDGTQRDVTGSVTWASSDPLVATVDENGLVHGVSRGTTTLSASLNQITETTTVTSGAAF